MATPLIKPPESFDGVERLYPLIYLIAWAIILGLARRSRRFALMLLAVTSALLLGAAWDFQAWYSASDEVERQYLLAAVGLLSIQFFGLFAAGFVRTRPAC